MTINDARDIVDAWFRELVLARRARAAAMIALREAEAREETAESNLDAAQPGYEDLLNERAPARTMPHPPGGAQ